MEFQPTIHFLRKQSQRGISKRMQDLTVRYGISVYHKGRQVYLLRNKDIKNLRMRGLISNQEADKLRNLTVIIEGTAAITTYRASVKKCKRIFRQSHI